MTDRVNAITLLEANLQTGVVVDAIALEGITLPRRDQVTTNELGTRLPRLLRAGLVLPVAEGDSEEEIVR